MCCKAGEHYLHDCYFHSGRQSRTLCLDSSYACECSTKTEVFLLLQLRNAYSLHGPKFKRPQALASETPAILHEDSDDEFDFGRDKARSATPFEEEVRTKALRAAQAQARMKALRSFEPVAHRREALKAFGKERD